MLRHAFLCGLLAHACVAHVSFTPTEDYAYQYAAEFSLYAGKANDSRAALSRFVPHARVCFDGRCGGPEILGRFENIVDEAVVQVPPAQMSIHENFLATRWHTLARVGHCRAHFSGTHVMYFNAIGKIVEYHDWPDYDFTEELQRMLKECGPPTSK
eukprot:Rhum_TRINITY_DN11004_c0_g1::Rhum_TRINITY_DN11004_c0_g1_i1::g.41817::m.41817